MSRPVITKAENAAHPVPSDALLAAWAGVTGMPLDALTELAQRAKSGTPDWFMPYRQAEATASILRCWSPLLVPGLLQTESYMRAVLSVEDYSAGQLDQHGGSSGGQGHMGIRADTRRRDAAGRVTGPDTSGRGTMESTDLNWRKASYSSNGGAECVEIGGTPRAVLVRDTQDRTGPMLRFSPEAWRSFTGQIKTHA